MMNTALKNEPMLPLLGPDDPAAVVIEQAESQQPFVIICDHADRLVPRCLGDLGLAPSAFDRHIAYDIGALWAARHLAARTGACLIHTRYSRLVLDANRASDDPGQIPAISDDTPVPANEDIGPADRARRQAALFTPYHAAIEAQLNKITATGAVPSLISIHSFTPVMKGVQRPWDIGFVWDQDARLVVPVMDHLRAAGWCVGDNEPYSARGFPRGYTNEAHAEQKGRPNLLVEFRQDLIDTPEKAVFWADQLAAPLLPLLAQRW